MSPRPAPGIAPEIAIALLAAGRSTRAGPHNKLLAEFGGQPLVRRAAVQALAAATGPVLVVTGYQAEEIRAALAGLDVTLVFNPDYAGGMASSIAAAARAVPATATGLMIHLADMPLVTAGHIAALADAFAAAGGEAIVRATAKGVRGNPVMFPRALFAGLQRLEGDSGARSLIEAAGLPVLPVEIGEAGALDVDTVEAIIAAGGQLPGGA
ncbi:nucleotidyltransferase family protein [Radicibacter daui]|uniref:nucleotidyltransferase family protein n=1 Tax=Radicibacter daui TaxID=3064829 RepID=UPI004046AB4B